MFLVHIDTVEPVRRSPVISERAFVASLRLAVGRYLAAVDQWETAYRRYYRMPGPVRPSRDLEAEQCELEARRRELEAMLPRARALCHIHGQTNVFARLTKVSLGRYAPQQRMESAIGRGERAAITNCLVELDVACLDAEVALVVMEQPVVVKTSWLDRLAGFFGLEA